MRRGDVTTIGLAWRQGRAARATSRRSSLTLRAVRVLAAKLPTWRRARTTIMQTAACASIDVGLFEWQAIAGWIGVGVSLFVLEALSGDE